MEVTRTTRSERLQGLLLLPAILLVFLALTTPLTTAYLGFGFDGRFYAAMEGDPRFDLALARVAPWCWRVLTPWMASLLPFATLTKFRVLAFGSNWLTLGLLYLTLRRSGLAHRYSVVGVLLYGGTFWALKFSYFEPVYVDFQTQTFIVAVMLCLVSRLHWPLPMLFALGALQKESMLLFIPVALVPILRDTQIRIARRLILSGLIILPSIAAMIVVRRLIHSVSPYDPVKVVTFLFGLLRSIDWWLIFIQGALSGLGILPALLLCFPRETVRVCRQSPEWSIAIVLGIGALFGGSDKGRLCLYMLPAIVLVASHVISESMPVFDLTISAWLAVTLSAHLFIGNLLTPIGTEDEFLARMMPEHAKSVLPRLYLISFVAITTCWAVLTLAFKRLRTAAAPRLSGP